MIKIKKLTPTLLEEGLTFNDYKKIARPLINAAKDKHKNVENQVDFFILTNFEFSDKPGKKTTIFVPGKQTNEWKQFLKQKFKDDKKNVMIGKCFIAEDSGKETLKLTPERGSAKMTIINKQGKKMFQMAKLAVELASGSSEVLSGSIPTPEELKRQKERLKKQTGNNQQSKTETTEQTSSGSQDKEELKKMLKEQLQGLAARVPTIKEGFNQVREVVSKFKSKEVSTTEEQQLEGVLDTLKDFVGSFESSHKEVQKRMKEAHKKVVAQMPKLELLHKRLREQIESLRQDEEETTTTTTETTSSGLDIEVLQELRQQMSTAKAAIDQLKKELDLDALLAEVN